MKTYGYPVSVATSRRTERNLAMANAQRRRNEAEARQNKRDDDRRAAKQAMKRARRGY